MSILGSTDWQGNLTILALCLTDEIHLESAKARMSRYSYNSRPGALLHTMVCWTRTNLRCACRTVPTNDQILVPESLLKKRKSQEKARAERTAATEKKKAVSTSPFPLSPSHGMVMKTTRID